jgi:hypothetical protein
LEALVSKLRGEGRGYKYTWGVAVEQGFTVTRDQMQEHCAHVERTVMSAHADAEDRGEEKTLEWYKRHGIDELPPGFVAGTIAISNGTHTSWFRTKADVPQENRVEIRQAEPVALQFSSGSPTFLKASSWRLWAIIPDCQVGFWVDFGGRFRTTHDERSFDLGHQIISYMASQEELFGIADCGDLLDLSAAGRWDPTAIDTSVHVMNKTFERASQELAWRRQAVGKNGQVVVMSGNHDDRLRQFANKSGTWLVGLKRPGDEEEWPVMSVPFLVRARDYDIEWIENFPGSYYKLNNNLVVMHSPKLGSKPFDTAKLIASTIHASVVHGHTHRSERASFNLETTEKGVRTFTVWSSGCWARIDGSLPSGKNSLSSYGDRLIAGEQGPNVGVLSENFHQGMDFVWVEVGGEERWSAEHVEFWGPWAQFRGHEFNAAVDADGNVLQTEASIADS